jgi:hypothetical protein
MHTEFVPADPGTATGFVYANSNANFLLRPIFQFTQLTHSAANNRDDMRTRHVTSFVTQINAVVTLFVTVAIATTTV